MKECAETTKSEFVDTGADGMWLEMRNNSMERIRCFVGRYGMKQCWPWGRNFI